MSTAATGGKTGYAVIYSKIDAPPGGPEGESRMPSLRAFFTNMSAPMPLHRKLYLVFRNNYIKIRHGQSCCGHPGEPGC